jgi:protein dithiol:quinone oxidoreductase
MTFQPGSRLLPAAGALACAASVLMALYAQHQMDMQPCPWCILQRLLFVLLAAWLAVAALLPRSTPQRIWTALAVAPAGAGIAAALWQHFVAAKTASCALTLADRILTATGLDTRYPEVFEVRANCSDAAVSVLGVPFEFWSLALFALIGALALAHALGRAPDARH